MHRYYLFFLNTPVSKSQINLYIFMIITDVPHRKICRLLLMTSGGWELTDNVPGLPNRFV